MIQTKFVVGKLYRKIGGGSIASSLGPINVNDIIMVLKINSYNEDPHFYNTLTLLFKDKIYNVAQPALWWEEIK
jgi:hypothetical protein